MSQTQHEIRALRVMVDELRAEPRGIAQTRHALTDAPPVAEDANSADEGE